KQFSCDLRVVLIDVRRQAISAVGRSQNAAKRRSRATEKDAVHQALRNNVLSAVVTARQMLFRVRSQGSVRSTDSTAGTCVAVRGGDELERAHAQGRNLRAWPVPARL